MGSNAALWYLGKSTLYCFRTGNIQNRAEQESTA